MNLIDRIHLEESHIGTRGIRNELWRRGSPPLLYKMVSSLIENACLFNCPYMPAPKHGL